MIAKLLIALVVIVVVFVCAFALAIVVGLAFTAAVLIDGVLPTAPERRIRTR